jgi:hypothetical protein
MLMMSAEHRREKAWEAAEMAKCAPSVWARAEWANMARDWIRVGAMADFQDQIPE